MSGGNLAAGVSRRAGIDIGRIIGEDFCLPTGKLPKDLMNLMHGRAAGIAVALVTGFLWLGGDAAAQTYCVKAARANLRAGPGKNFRITWEVNKYMPLVQVDKKGDWIKVKDVDGDTHWVFKTLLDAKLKCVTVRSARANIRKGPSASGRQLYTVEKYTSFKLVGKKRKWVQIAYGKKKMWVFHTLIWPPPK